MSQLPDRRDPDQIREAAELIDGQYADRPHLRPVLDAVLAALPGLGPVTVQARTTLVSLVTPRRTFAVVQATTKNRVDLGLRLDTARPGGRLLAARDVGAATVRIGLSAPGDLDEEALGWLRRAYEENIVPAPPRRPARRPAPVVGQLTVVIEGFDLPGLTCGPVPGGPGHQNVHVALGGPGKDRRGPAGLGGDRPTLAYEPGSPGLAYEPVSGDAPAARWEVTVTVRRSSAATAPTGTSAWPGATCRVTERCGCSAAPSSGSPTSAPGSSSRRCAPASGWSPGSG